MRPGCGLRRGTGSFNVPPLGALCLPVLLALLVWLAAAPVTAHEGHDLEIPESPGASRAVPRLVADSESYELVAVLEGQRLVIYLDRFEDNSPVTDANMIVTINEEPVVAQAPATAPIRSRPRSLNAAAFSNSCSISKLPKATIS